MSDESYLQVYRALYAIEHDESRAKKKRISIYGILAALAVLAGIPLIAVMHSAAEGRAREQQRIVQRHHDEPAKTAVKTVDTSSYVGPKILYEALPDAKRFAAPGVRYRGAKVEVEVEINETGRVTNARYIESDSDPHVEGALKDAALYAARQWTFTPAAVRGKPVPSTHKIVFEFQK